MEKDAIRVFHPDQYESHTTGVEKSNNYYFPALDLATLSQKNPHLSARAARIEANDTEAPLHQHPGVTIGFVISGSGVLRGEGEEHAIKEGDTFYIPAYASHVFLADKGTEMVQKIVYISSPEELQDYIPV